MTAPLVIWDPRMLGYELGEIHPLHPLRWELTWVLPGDLGALDEFPVLAPDPASDGTLGRTHTAGYIAAVREASEVFPGAVGNGLGMPDNPVFPGMHDNAVLIAGESIEAARAIAYGRVNRAVNCGGLHTRWPTTRPASACTTTRRRPSSCSTPGIRKVAYADADAHHGDGVQAAFYDDPRVLTVSIHESPLSLRLAPAGLPKSAGARRRAPR